MNIDRSGGIGGRVGRVIDFTDEGVRETERNKL